MDPLFAALICAITAAPDAPQLADGGGGGGDSARQAVPTVPTERRAVQLPESTPELTEDQRLERALGAFAAPPPTPPAEVSKLDTSPNAAPSEPSNAPANPPAPLETSTPEPPTAARQSEATDLVSTLERVTAREREIGLAQQQLEQERARLQRFADFEKKLREEDAVAALESLGVSFDDVSRAAIEKRGVKGAPASKVEQQIEELRAELTTLREERESARREQLERQARDEIGSAITSSSPLLARLGERARDEVFSRITLHYQRTGEILPTAQAISAVEGDYSAIVTHALADETVRSRFLPNQSVATRVSDRPPPVTQATPTTITNAHAGELPPRAASDVYTEEEREARALRHLEG